MKPLRKILLVAGVLLAGAAATVGWQLHQNPPLAPYADLAWKAKADPKAAPFRVTFAGVATLLFDDGETAVMTDGFFSRPGMAASLIGTVEPDLDAIARGLSRLGVPDKTRKLAAVIPVHSHYDHAMDAPEVARRTGARLVGSESTANVGRGWGLKPDAIQVVTLGETLTFGRFRVSFLASRHAPTGFTGGEITEPMQTPARAFAYREGQTYALVIRHGERTVLVNGSAGFEPGALDGVRADVVLLGIGTLGQRDPAYREAYWDAVVKATGARRVIPIHWDNLWQPAEPPLQAMPVPIDRFTDTMDFLRERARRDGVDLRMPAEWQAMDLWDGLPPAPPR